jgi:hypothetical protein
MAKSATAVQKPIISRETANGLIGLNSKSISERWHWTFIPNRWKNWVIEQSKNYPLIADRFRTQYRNIDDQKSHHVTDTVDGDVAVWSEKDLKRTRFSWASFGGARSLEACTLHLSSSTVCDKELFHLAITASIQIIANGFILSIYAPSGNSSRRDSAP